MYKNANADSSLIFAAGCAHTKLSTNGNLLDSAASRTPWRCALTSLCLCERLGLPACLQYCSQYSKAKYTA